MKIIEKRMPESAMEKLLYLLLALGLIADILFLIVNRGDVTFSVWCFVCVLAGSVVGMANVFLPGDVMLWLASIFYTAGFGFHLYVTLPSLSDLWYQVNFIGGNQPVAIVFGCIFGVIMIVLLISNFIIDEKVEPTHEENGF